LRKRKNGSREKKTQVVVKKFCLGANPKITGNKKERKKKGVVVVKRQKTNREPKDTKRREKK